MEISEFRPSPVPGANLRVPALRRPAAVATRVALPIAMLGGCGVIGMLVLEGAAAMEVLPWMAAQLALGYAAMRCGTGNAQGTRLRLLAESVADSERKRISLDLHDSAIQPYLGLKLGLEAMRRKVAPDNPLAQDIDELCRMTHESIAELRGYVRVLGGESGPGSALAGDLHRQIERFRRFYGLDVTLHLAPDLDLDGRIATEIVRMIGEALSNVGRHTASRQVGVTLAQGRGRLTAEIVDHGGAGRETWHSFTPVSLTRRAAYLGGRVEIAPQPDGGTAVRISIPT